MDVKEALRKLCLSAGPSGFESPAAQAAKELLEPLVDEASIDRSGNVIGWRRCGKPGAKTLLLDAHLDEVALFVSNIEDGFLRVRGVGIDPRVLTDREVTVLTDPPVFGVVSCLAPHVMKPEDRDKAPTMDQIAIDVGMSQESAVKAIPIGTPIVYRQEFTQLLGDRIASKSLDDRACFVTVLRAAELLKDVELDVDLCIVGSTCEEVGGWGARTAAFGAAPDYAVAVDVTFAQSPGLSPDEVPCKLGGGPAIGVGPVIARWMSNRLKAKAKAEEIPYEIEILSGFTGTNGDEYQTAREGIATAVVSLPQRYMHTPMEVIDLDDIEQTARLLAAFAKDLGKEAETVC